MTAGKPPADDERPCHRRCRRTLDGKADGTVADAAATARPRDGSDVVGVDYAVGVALFGEEALAVGGEVLVQGVAGDDAVEAGGASAGLGAQDAA